MNKRIALLVFGTCLVLISVSIFAQNTAPIFSQLELTAAATSQNTSAIQTQAGVATSQPDKYAQIDGYDGSGVANAVNQKIKDTGSAETIVTLKHTDKYYYDLSDTPSRRQAKKNKFQNARAQVAAAVGKGVAIKRNLQIINGLALTVNTRELNALAHNPAVEKIDLDTKVQFELDPALDWIGAPAAWSRKDSKGFALTGTNTRVAIIDTGVNYLLPELGGCLGSGCKIIGGYNFINNTTDPMDILGHGTMVAQIVASVAPGAKIVAYVIGGSTGYVSSIISSINSAVDPNGDGNPSDHLDVINMSLGYDCGTSYTSSCGPADSLSTAVDNAGVVGIVSAVSDGNGSAGLVKSPGVAWNAVAVGAVCDPSQTASAPYCTTTSTSSLSSSLQVFSRRGPALYNGVDYHKPDVVAPGFATSVSTPYVAGALAILKQAHPTYTPAQLKNLLKMSATDLGNGLAYDDEGAGIVNLRKALACGTLATNASLAPGQSVTSCNGRYGLILQTDGNVVLYDNTKQWPANIVWNTATNGKAAARLSMQGDGNLVLYNASSTALWASSWHGGTIGKEGKLAVQDDGNLVIYATINNSVLWASNTKQTAMIAPASQIAAVYQAIKSQFAEVVESAQALFVGFARGVGW